MSLLVLVYNLFQIFKEKIRLIRASCDLFFFFKILKNCTIIQGKQYD